MPHFDMPQRIKARTCPALTSTLHPHLSPLQIHVLEGMPTTASGKVLKTALRQQLGGGLGAAAAGSKLSPHVTAGPEPAGHPLEGTPTEASSPLPAAPPKDPSETLSGGVSHTRAVHAALRQRPPLLYAQQLSVGQRVPVVAPVGQRVPVVAPVAPSVKPHCGTMILVLPEGGSMREARCQVQSGLMVIVAWASATDGDHPVFLYPRHFCRMCLLESFSCLTHRSRQPSVLCRVFTLRRPPPRGPAPPPMCCTSTRGLSRTSIDSSSRKAATVCASSHPPKHWTYSVHTASMPLSRSFMHSILHPQLLRTDGICTSFVSIQSSYPLPERGPQGGPKPRRLWRL